MAQTKLVLRAGAWLVCAIGATGIAPAQVSEIILHNFAPPPNGATPHAGVIRDSAGNLYGTTGAGGTYNMGIVYKLDTAGHLTVLHSFTGGVDGGTPISGVIRDPAGNLFGTTYLGGPTNEGVVFKVDTTGNLTVLYTFKPGADGGYPHAGVIRDSAGNLYGTTTGGGETGTGMVYKLDATGHLTVLYSFTGEANGASPYSGVIRDSAGNLYGTNYSGGAAFAGVVYKVDTNGQETVLYNFTGGADGSSPDAGVTADSAGNLYGTTLKGGTGKAGVVYKLDSTGHETVLYSFTGGADGAYPYAGVTRDLAGNLYGTTYAGGSANAGVVYKLNTAGQETALYSFTGGADGANPNGPVIEDSAGNLYGTTAGGGTANLGSVYKLDASGQETVLFDFLGAAGGYQPYGGVIGDSAGNLYGTTQSGGTANDGVVYALDTAGHETVLYTFTGGADGKNPTAGVVRDLAGNLYGTAYGGRAGGGVVYMLNTTGHLNVLYSFTGGADGSSPEAGVIRDSAGNLYGTTQYGGIANAGVVYKVDAAGHQSVLYSFTGGGDGANPYAGVIRDSAGNLYGTTVFGGAGWGVVYKLDTASQETVLYSFTGADASEPHAGVIRDPAGNLYGTTTYGGPGGAGAGVVYELDNMGLLTVLYSFTGVGGYPDTGVIRDSAGNLYGTTCCSIPGLGTVYKLDSTGQSTLLYNFTGGADGGSPQAGVIRDPAGNLYGTTFAGGKWNGGVVFKLSGVAAPE